MSALSEQDHLNPNNPTYYAPRYLRERPESPPSALVKATPEPAKSPIAGSASLDHQLENAVSDALWHPLDPEVVHEPPGFAQERDRRKALLSVASRFAAAVGVSAVVALFFVFMIPASRDRAPDASASSFTGAIQSIRSALFQPAQNDDGMKPALAEFRAVLTSDPASQPAITHEQSDTLLQGFKQWGQKPGPSGAPR